MHAKLSAVILCVCRGKGCVYRTFMILASVGFAGTPCNNPRIIAWSLHIWEVLITMIIIVNTVIESKWNLNFGGMDLRSSNSWGLIQKGILNYSDLTWLKGIQSVVIRSAEGCLGHQICPIQGGGIPGLLRAISLCQEKTGWRRSASANWSVMPLSTLYH